MSFRVEELTSYCKQLDGEAMVITDYFPIAYPDKPNGAYFERMGRGHKSIGVDAYGIFDLELKRLIGKLDFFSLPGLFRGTLFQFQSDRFPMLKHTEVTSMEVLERIGIGKWPGMVTNLAYSANWYVEQNRRGQRLGTELVKGSLIDWWNKHPGSVVFGETEKANVYQIVKNLGGAFVSGLKIWCASRDYDYLALDSSLILQRNPYPENYWEFSSANEAFNQGGVTLFGVGADVWGYVIDECVLPWGFDMYGPAVHYVPGLVGQSIGVINPSLPLDQAHMVARRMLSLMVAHRWTNIFQFPTEMEITDDFAGTQPTVFDLLRPSGAKYWEVDGGDMRVFAFGPQGGGISG